METTKKIIDIENINSNLINMSCQDGLFTKKKDELKQIVKNFNNTIPISKLNKAQLLCLILELSKKAQPKPQPKQDEAKPQPKPSQKVEAKPQTKQDELNVNDFKMSKWLRSAIFTYASNKKTKKTHVGVSKMGGDALRKYVIDKKMDLIKLAYNYITQINIDLNSYEGKPEAKKIKKVLDEFISRVGSKGMKQIEEIRKAEKEEYKKYFNSQMTPQKMKQIEEDKQTAFIQKRFEENQKKLSAYKYSNDLADMVKRFVRNEYRANGGLKAHKEMEKEFKEGLENLPDGEYKEDIKELIAYNLEEMYWEDGSHISKSLFNFLSEFVNEED
jgi:hypothetical protein